jgi:hypothetical protein
MTVVLAPCPRCGAWTADLTAEHLEPYALTGSEGGPLSVLCRSCNSKLGAAMAHRRPPEGASETRGALPSPARLCASVDVRENGDFSGRA